MVGNIRWSNVSDVRAYISLRAEEKKVEQQRLSRFEQMEETMFLGLRMTEGVSAQAFAECFGRSLEEVYGEVINRHCRQGLLENDRCLRLTDKGIDVSNYVLADFLL